MKKIIGFITIVAIIATLGYFLQQILSKVKGKQEAASRIENLPSFNLQTIDSTSFSNKDLMSDKATVVLFFNSECDFCKHEAQSIYDELKQFHNTQFLFISSEETKAIANFAATYQLNNQPNITFLYDHNNLFSTELDIQLIPTVLVYNAQHKLLKKHTGQLNANGILKIINKREISSNQT
jgi:thiol-disulfide isomerase/thioredoxin